MIKILFLLYKIFDGVGNLSHDLSDWAYESRNKMMTKMITSKDSHKISRKQKREFYNKW